MSSVQASARQTLISAVEEHIHGIVRAAISVSRHSKRSRLNNGIARSRIHAIDINIALQLQGAEKLYITKNTNTSNTGNNTKKSSQPVFLETIVKDDLGQPLPPTEVAIRQRWLAVDGIQPNTTASALQASAQSSGQDTGEGINSTNDSPAGIEVHKLLQAGLLSEELKLFFQRVTTGQDYEAVSTTNGIQELVPFLIRYAVQQLYTGKSVRLVQCMLLNPSIHLELHLHELLPALMTCTVAKKLSSWTLRRESAAVLYLVCKRFSNEYTSLQSRVLQALCQALTNNNAGSFYGAAHALALFGSRAVAAFLLPVLPTQWEEWENMLQQSSISYIEKNDILMCQQSALVALHVVMQDRTIETSNELVDVMGDRTAAMGVPNVYATCFI